MKKLVLLVILCTNIFGAVELNLWKENFKGKEFVVGTTTDNENIVLTRGKGITYELLYSYDIFKKSRISIEPFIAYGGTIGNDSGLNYEIMNKGGDVKFDESYMEIGSYLSYKAKCFKIKVGASINKPKALVIVNDDELYYEGEENFGYGLSGLLVIKNVPWYIPNALKAKYTKTNFVANRALHSTSEINLDKLDNSYPREINDQMISISILWSFFENKGDNK